MDARREKGGVRGRGRYLGIRVRGDLGVLSCGELERAAGCMAYGVNGEIEQDILVADIEGFRVCSSGGRSGGSHLDSVPLRLCL